jgi:hypothetical protein
LVWWKNLRDEYPILSQLARDVLASKSSFNAGGCVVDPFRSRLDPEMVEALVCTKDWITQARKGDALKLMLLLNVG